MTCSRTGDRLGETRKGLSIVSKAHYIPSFIWWRCSSFCSWF